MKNRAAAHLLGSVAEFRHAILRADVVADREDQLVIGAHPASLAGFPAVAVLGGRKLPIRRSPPCSALSSEACRASPGMRPSASPRNGWPTVRRPISR